MAKIQFTLEAWLKDKSQKVETRSGKNVRIICWDKIGVPIVALVGDADDIVTYNRDGTTGQQMQLPSDLFIVTPEEELTEFEKELESFYNYHLQVCTYDNQGLVEDSLHDGASKLLALARKQLEPEIKAEVLKDLPRWKKAAAAFGNYSVAPTETGALCLLIDGYYIMLFDLKKLPGFKDEDHE